MIVTFISECEKKAHKRTRRVLDAFANRIGTNTWQTVITKEGLIAVQKLLKKTASKNTAVSCHKIKSRQLTELLWIVGNKDTFNNEGYVAVNYTQQDFFIGENQIKDIDLIKNLAVFAALFHDFGKSSNTFQNKLKGKGQDGLRHEWVSILYLTKFINYRDDKDWLEDLLVGDLDAKFNDLDFSNIQEPFKNTTNLVQIISWLIFTHHKLPKKNEDMRDAKFNFSNITDEWGYKNNDNINNCFEFNELISKSKKWQNEVKKYALNLITNLEQLEQSFNDGSYRLIGNYARTCLMLGDHYFSSLPKDNNFKSELSLYANTDKKGLKQYLDEHILGVAKQTKLNVDKLLSFENLPPIFNNKQLSKLSPKQYAWQDDVVKKIKKWRNSQELDNSHFGFFAVNMASTGTGKTFANAKITQALSPKHNSLRYTLALGLRTLTLQTGDEYREKIGLDDSELAVLIGSKAISELHNNNIQQEANIQNNTGSESQQSLYDGEVGFNADLEKGLDTVLKNEKSKKLLYAPVLSCTIDHIIGATETMRGGKYILPNLRLMGADLVIDEIDDFDGKDLIAIGRLIYQAAMFGRKVVISSATIPPDMAFGFFNAYKAGWEIFAKMRNKKSLIGCLWVDEFSTICETYTDYAKQHKKFIDKRVDKLETQPAKRKVNIVKCSTDIDEYFLTIKQEIINKHNNHHIIDNNGNKVSIGVVRMANIKPCIELTKYLLEQDFGDVEVRVMAYHSQQVLLMRHEQEKYLDSVLKSRNKEEKILDEEIIKTSKNKNIIFVLVATPVEEVGRDHDFDWAIIEPSSFRSFIQMAGRVLRHRDIYPTTTNIGILQYNYKYLQGEKIVFTKPGYQIKKKDLSSCDLMQLINEEKLADKLDATNRIQDNNACELSNLEHRVIKHLLTENEIRLDTLKGWCESEWWLSAMPQKYIKFRENLGDRTLFLTLDDGFVEKDNWGNIQSANKLYQIEKDPFNNFDKLWLKKDYGQLLQQAQQDFNKQDLEQTALSYGEINITTYGQDINGIIYNEQLGFIRK
jgi:CRISPR-associated endonuclease/helicase Cas3